MLSGTVEPQYGELLLANVPALRSAVSGADAASPMPAATPASADDAPPSGATKLLAHATIHPTVNGMAKAGCPAGSAAVK